MKKRGKIVCLSLVVFFIISLNFSFVIANEGGFEVDSVLLRLTIKQGESVDKALNIKAVNEGTKLSISENNLDFISFSEEEFDLEIGEEKEIIINFNTKDKESGIYVGEILVSNDGTIIIPVILEIESQEVLFDGSIIIPPEYGKVYVGGYAVIENKIVNLERIGSKVVEIDYFLKDFKGREIYSEKESLPIEIQVLNTKTIPIPSDVGVGDYVFGAIIKYKDSIGTTSYLIKISDEKENEFFSKDNYLLWVVIFLLIGLLFFIIYYMRQRDKVLIGLQRQYKSELRKEYGRHKNEEVKAIKLKPKQRKHFLRKLFKKKQKRVKAIKGIYKKRVEVAKKLKKTKKKGIVEKKLGEWKKQGYNIDEFLIKTGKFKEKGSGKNKGGESLSKKVGKLKDKGYKLG